jgi:hypothetical protein
MSEAKQEIGARQARFRESHRLMLNLLRRIAAGKSSNPVMEAASLVEEIERE